LKISKLRFLIQSAGFILLTYGGKLGLRFGHALPCFACPYAGGCAGDCYLMALQGSKWGFQIKFSDMISYWGLKALGMLTLFILLTFMLSKTWCGWICPFGTLQDWITILRRKLGIRESRMSWNMRDRLKPIKYIILALLIVIPFLIANAGLHPDLDLFFCQICPAKVLMPVFEGNFMYFSVDTTNAITTVMTILSLVLTAFFLAGIFFKERFFCIFCPLLALISIFDRLGFWNLKKKVEACSGCGTCQRVCTVDIRDVHMEKEKADVLTQDCMLCTKCIESCAQDNTLSLRFINRKLFSSSKGYVAKYFIRPGVNPESYEK
jgi:ferredoxin-type protein NapH